MSFKGKVAAWWYVATAALNGIAIAALIYQGLSTVLAVNLVIVVLINLYFIPPIFKYEVIITKKEVVIKFGLLTKTVPIQNITVVKIMKSYSASFAASFDRVGIEARNMTDVFISLEDNSAFIKELLRKNRKIKYLI
ncbi:MAG: hypothetical protein HFH03_01390 [Dorea sp.]|jgi:hypothetical protein|nr:hypothetical protein [Dorea sp.]